MGGSVSSICLSHVPTIELSNWSAHLDLICRPDWFILVFSESGMVYHP